MLQIGRDKKNKVISPYIMLYFVVCMLQIGRDKKKGNKSLCNVIPCSLNVTNSSRSKSNKSLYNVILCSLYVTNRSR